MSPTFAESSVTFGISSHKGEHAASGSLTWLNRSVGVQGKVTDVGGAGTRVQFTAYVGITPVQTQVRPTRGETAIDETVSYHFTLDGSAYKGGISEVDIWISDEHGHQWAGPTRYMRK